MTSPRYLIRSASLEEIQEFHYAWAFMEGWNPGRYDWKNFPKIDLPGFLVGCVDNQVVACISAVQLSDSFGFIGYYICKKDFRGKGYGLQLFQAALQRLSHLSCIGLDGVPAQVENYRKSGFQVAYESRRYCSAKGAFLSHSEKGKEKLVSLRGNEEQALKMMWNIYQVSMPAYLSAVLEDPETKGLVLFSEGASVMKGWGLIRPATDGWRVGPLYAENAETASILFLGLIESLPSEANVYIDVPLINHPAVALVESLGMRSVSSCMRMYKGETPLVALSEVFGLLSWEIGP